MKREKFHLVVYVESSNIKLKRFATKKGMKAFMARFRVEHPDHETGDNWIDYTVSDVYGDIVIYDPTISLAEDSLA